MTSQTTQEDEILNQEDKENKDFSKDEESFKPKDPMVEVEENVYKILEKVKRSASVRNPNFTKPSQLPLPPPPPPTSCPLDDATEKLLNALARQRTPVSVASILNDRLVKRVMSVPYVDL